MSNRLNTPRAHWNPRRIPHTLPALLAPLPALPLRHRNPATPDKDGAANSPHQLDSFNRPSLASS
ncbi:MAG TPA: hypothetical protein VHP37_20235, partial [Burkholderiales bacterium]|nr:hypothetical protein [Burkholderiales bacterium]